MEFFFLLLLLLWYIIIYSIVKSIWHPAILCMSSWIFILVLYLFTNHPLYPLSNKFYISFSLWIFPFTIVSLLIGNMHFKIPSLLKSNTYNGVVIDFLYPLLLLSFLIIDYQYYSLVGGSLDPFNELRGITLEGTRTVFPTYAVIFMYFSIPAQITLLLFILKYGLFSKKTIVLLLFTLSSVLISATKGTIVVFTFSLIYLLYKKKQISYMKVCICILSLFSFIFIITLMRNMNNEVDYKDLFFGYILSPLPAFDMLVNGIVNWGDKSVFGSETFVFFRRLLSTLGLIEFQDVRVADNWVNVPVRTNVYTVMSSFYMDFGNVGIFLFSILYGSIYGLIYNYSKKNVLLFIILYASWAPFLVLQFFSDYFFFTLSIQIQRLFALILLLIPFRIYKIKSYH